MGSYYPINTRYPFYYLIAPIGSFALAGLLFLYLAYSLLGRWRADHGVRAAGIITELSEVNRPDGSTFYFVSVNLHPSARTTLQLEKNVEAQLFHALRVNQRQRIRYQPDQPNNFLLQSEPLLKRDEGISILFGLASMAIGMYSFAGWRRNRRLYS